MDPRPPLHPRAAGIPGRALIAVGVAMLCGVGPPLAGRAAAAGASVSPGNTLTAVVGSILGHADAPFPGSDGKAHLVYEVWLTNAKPAPATLDRIEIVAADGGRVLKNLTGEALVAALHTLDAKPAGSAALPPNESRLLYVELGFPTIEAAPARILHRLSGSAAASPAAREATAVRYDLAPIDVSREPLPVLAAPLAGARWVAVNGCCGPGGAHRGAVQSINGRLWDSQRFAIDWMRFDELGRLVTGDPSDVRNWVSYGTPIQAVRDGVVIESKDGLADQVPGRLPAPGTITVETVDGNHVVLDHGGGVFTFYAHMVPGSVAVKIGDRVTTGQRLGLLGNSGNTSAPHLHFHVMSGPSPLGSDGMPYVLDRFTLLGTIDGGLLGRALEGGALGAGTVEGEPSAMSGVLPMNLDLVEFVAR